MVFKTYHSFLDKGEKVQGIRNPMLGFCNVPEPFIRKWTQEILFKPLNPVQKWVLYTDLCKGMQAGRPGSIKHGKIKANCSSFVGAVLMLFPPYQKSQAWNASWVNGTATFKFSILNWEDLYIYASLQENNTVVFSNEDFFFNHSAYYQIMLYFHS